MKEAHWERQLRVASVEDHWEIGKRVDWDSWWIDDVIRYALSLRDLYEPKPIDGHGVYLRFHSSPGQQVVRPRTPVSLGPV